MLGSVVLLQWRVPDSLGWSLLSGSLLSGSSDSHSFTSDLTKWETFVSQSHPTPSKSYELLQFHKYIAWWIESSNLLTVSYEEKTAKIYTTSENLGVLQCSICIQLALVQEHLDDSLAILNCLSPFMQTSVCSLSQARLHQQPPQDVRLCQFWRVPVYCRRWGLYLTLLPFERRASKDCDMGSEAVASLS